MLVGIDFLSEVCNVHNEPENMDGFVYIYQEYKVPLLDVVDLKSQGCRKFKRGDTAIAGGHS